MRTHKKFLALLCLIALFSFAACGDDDAPSEDTEAGAPGEAEGADEETDAGECSEGVTTESGLQIEDIECGEGDEAASGQLVSVHYVGTLEDGTQFDSSRERGEPFQFPLGGGQVIQGWDEGVVGMKIGGLRKLTIPPDLGYGKAGAGGVIPPDATLIFEIELLGVEEIGG